MRATTVVKMFGLPTVLVACAPSSSALVQTSSQAIEAAAKVCEKSGWGARPASDWHTLYFDGTWDVRSNPSRPGHPPALEVRVRADTGKPDDCRFRMREE